MYHEYKQKMDTQSLIRSVVIGGNFFFGVVLTIWMIALSTNKDRVGAQIFHTSISQQTHDPLLENTIRVMSNATETGVSDIPLIEVSRSNDGYFIIAAVHPQFLFFSSLVISSCFALTSWTSPSGDVHYFSMSRVLIVHLWNLLSLVAIVIIYTTYTYWGHVPLSNFFYSLGLVGLTWIYSYWHMIDATHAWVRPATLGPNEMDVASSPDVQEEKNKNAADTVRKNIVQEMSLTFPLFFISTLLQGNAGMDQWRLQTIFFTSWAFFALYGMFYRFVETYLKRESQKAKASAENHEDEKLACVNAIAFIAFSMVVVFIQTVLALGTRIIFSSGRFPYFSDALNTMKVGQLFMLLTMIVLLADVGRTVISIQWFDKDDLSSSLRFGGNIVIIALGSVLTKLFYFIALSNSDSWTVVA